MKVRCLCIGGLLLFVSLLGAQDFDRCLLSAQDITGSARYVSMAGAFASLGGDVSAITDNPAALGVFRRRELSFTLDEQFIFSHTDTKAYEDSYIPKGDDYFTEDSVLEDTDFFADVTVLSARLDSDSAHYTLRINSLVSKTGEESETNITIESSTPYIMQENREYFIPLREENGTYSMVFENAPQIEISLDGDIVFQNGWKSLDDDSGILKGSQKSKNDYFYDRMRYSSKNDLQDLLAKWRTM